MEHDSIIGLDIAKTVFQLHRMDSRGAVLERRRLRRGLAAFAGRKIGVRSFILASPAGGSLSGGENVPLPISSEC